MNKMEEIIINGEIIKVRIVRKNNKNLYFRFTNTNELLITIPNHLTLKRVYKIIKENEKAITKMYLKNKVKQIPNNEVRILGLQYELKFDEKVNKVIIDNGILFAQNQTALDKYIKYLTKKVFAEEIDNILKIMPNIPSFTLKIRKMKSRWGVCNYVKKIVTLNSELIKYPRQTIDYVIIHEFSHFTFHNHQREFWQLVFQYCPNYKESRKELREK